MVQEKNDRTHQFFGAVTLLDELIKELSNPKAKRLEASATVVSAILAFAELPLHVREEYVAQVIASRGTGKIDQLAAQARKGELRYRIELLADASRLRQQASVVAARATKDGGAPKPPKTKPTRNRFRHLEEGDELPPEPPADEETPSDE